MKEKIFIAPLLAIFLFSCTKEYITNEYITNEYENVYTNQYYLTNDMEEVTNDIRPDYLKKGDTVAVFAPASALSANQQKQVKSNIEVLKSWGLAVIEADNLYKEDKNGFSGEQTERIAALQKLVDNPNIKALIASRGGYGTNQVAPYIDWSKMQQHPKWFVGYSDITFLHAMLNNSGFETIHGAMAANFSDEKSVESLRKALFGELTSYENETNKNSVEGTATGRLVGGNLSLLYSLGGTLYDLNVKNAILLIEDVGEKTYHIERMMYNLKQSGKLDCVKGIIVGEFTNMTQGNDKSIEEIMEEQLHGLDIPIVYGFSAGHDDENLSLYLGRRLTIEVGSKTTKLTFSK